MNFGVSGNMGACSSHIYSNPVTIAAVKRQQEKERARGEAAPTAKQTMTNIISEKMKAKRIAEENWRTEFLSNIRWLRREHIAKVAHNHMVQILSQYRIIDVIRDDNVPTERVTCEQIKREGIVGTGFTMADIEGMSRHKPLVELRQQLIAKCFTDCVPKQSLAMIGKSFGNRDHTTVLHAVMKMGVHPSQLNPLQA